MAAGLKAYRFSKLYDPDRFFDVLDLASNGAAIKRLGVLAELLRLPMGDILGTLGGRRTKGIVELEPGAGTAGPIDAYWGVRINVDLDAQEDEDDPYDDEELEDLELM